MTDKKGKGSSCCANCVCSECQPLGKVGPSGPLSMTGLVKDGPALISDTKGTRERAIYHAGDLFRGEGPALKGGFCCLQRQLSSDVELPLLIKLLQAGHLCVSGFKPLLFVTYLVLQQQQPSALPWCTLVRMYVVPIEYSSLRWRLPQSIGDHHACYRAAVTEHKREVGCRTEVEVSLVPDCLQTEPPGCCGGIWALWPATC